MSTKMADSGGERTQTGEEMIMNEQTDENKNKDETNDLKEQKKQPQSMPTKGKPQKGEPVQVDLSKLKTKNTAANTLHSKSSLPNTLAQYGLDEKKQARAKARADKDSKDKKRKRSNTFYGEDERDKEKERLRDEKYMQVLDDLRKLRNYYYSEYRDLLGTKVEKQRKEIRNKTEAQQKKQQEQAERERQESHRVKKRHTHHKLQNDDTFIKNVPKSDVYLILGLQEKMIREGKLKCQEDLDRFWMEMRKPEIFFSHFPNGLAATTGLHSKMAVAARRASREDSLPRALSQIAESKETSRPTTQGTWAVTQRYSHIHQQADGASTTLIRNASPSKQAALELERRFPKLEMPPLHCFTMDLGEKPPDPVEVKTMMELKVREKQRRRFLKKLHKMHQLAMANSAAATRILDKHTDLAFLMEGPELTDLISDYYWEESRPVTVPRSTRPEGRLPPVSGGVMNNTRPTRVDDLFEEDNTQSRPRTVSSVTSRHRAPEQQLVLYQPSKPLPLTMEEVKEKNRIVEAKILSSYWNNYMQSGKKVLINSPVS